MAPALGEEVQNLAFIVHGAPEPIALPLDDDHHLIEVPVIARLGTGAAQVSGEADPNFRNQRRMLRSTTLRAVGDVQASFGEHLLHIAETQGESGIQPD